MPKQAEKRIKVKKMHDGTLDYKPARRTHVKVGEYVYWECDPSSESFQVDFKKDSCPFTETHFDNADPGSTINKCGPGPYKYTFSGFGVVDDPEILVDDGVSFAMLNSVVLTAAGVALLAVGVKGLVSLCRCQMAGGIFKARERG